MRCVTVTLALHACFTSVAYMCCCSLFLNRLRVTFIIYFTAKVSFTSVSSPGDLFRPVDECPHGNAPNFGDAIKHSAFICCSGLVGSSVFIICPQLLTYSHAHEHLRFAFTFRRGCRRGETSHLLLQLCDFLLVRVDFVLHMRVSDRGER